MRPSRHSVLIAIGCIATFGIATGAAAAESTAWPNVLFILCDDLRPDAVGCYGSKHVRTPRIDALAAEGVRFSNAFCTTSLCFPSRARILTGLYAHGHRVRNNFTELPAALPHWPGRLREQGYATAYIGKWHMGEDNDEPAPASTDSSPTRVRESTSTRSRTSTASDARPCQAFRQMSSPTSVSNGSIKGRPVRRGRSASATKPPTRFMSRSRSTCMPSTTCECPTRRALFDSMTSPTGSASVSPSGTASTAHC
ncbi:MAG: sulfatase-like hydrolase/transferase [Planctomycetaceae bacterium]|nr:sulfatase-like hydrolase/transferase [Planctomycetaceae bacterium]